MLEDVKYLTWGDFTSLFMSGSPPLLYVLCALNGLVFAIWLWRKGRNARRMRHDTSVMLQVLVIVLNLGAIWRESILQEFDVSYKIKQTVTDIFRY